MQRSVLCGLILGMACLLLSGSASATEKAEQIKRDAIRLNQIHKIALASVVIQLRFDQSKRIPDRERMIARTAVMAQIPLLLYEEMKSGKYDLLLPQATTMALQDLHWQTTDLYTTISKGTWEAPVETIGNEEKDKALLLANREELKKTPAEMTLFRYIWHDRPGIVVGLASFKLNAQAKINTERARILGAKLEADALLFCQVGDMEVDALEADEGSKDDTWGGIDELLYTKSTSIHLYFTLVSAQDGAILWQARARGVQSNGGVSHVESRDFDIFKAYEMPVSAQIWALIRQARAQSTPFHKSDLVTAKGRIAEAYQTQVLAQPDTILWQVQGVPSHRHKGSRVAYPSELGMAIEGAMKAVKSLTDDLYNGTGKVLKLAFKSWTIP